MIYPDLETVSDQNQNQNRGGLSTFDRLNFSKTQSNLEKNCNQIFIKGPALTKDIFKKMDADLVPKKTCILKYELETRHIFLLLGLFILFFASLYGVIVMWFTQMFDDAVFSTVYISNNSANYEMWRSPKVKPLTKVYLYNYTNADDFLLGYQTKLNVREVGPLIYEEKLEKINVQFNDNENTVSYQEKRTYNFRSDLTKVKQSQMVTVPNVPLMAGASKVRNENFFSRLAFNGFLSGINEKPFITLAADSFIMGYQNTLFDISKTVMPNKKMPKSFGLFTGKAGVQPSVFTMHTGKNDIDKIGTIERIDGEEEFDYWSTQECNSFESSDGLIYPPKTVQNKQPLSYLLPQMCRTIPMVFEKEVTILEGKIPAYKYVVPEDIFDSAEENPKNQCYCSLSTGICPLKGVFNVSACNFDAPLLVSHPRFKNAEKSIREAVTGIKEEDFDYRTHLNIHPLMGFAMTGRIRMQVNVQVKKANGVYVLDKFPDDIILPVAWFEGVLDEGVLNDETLDLIYQSTYTFEQVKLVFKFGCLLTNLITWICIMLVLRKWYRNDGVVNI